MGVTLDDYFIYSFRLRGISVLSDGDVHPVFVQKNARHKRWDSTVNYINPSLSKALRANDLLAGNNLLEGLGSQYSGYPKFFALFLPKKSIKILPANADNQRGLRPFVIMKNTSHSAGSLNSLDSQSKKCSFTSDQVDSNAKRVKFEENSILLSEINIST